jgi:DNA sulfur modification protein DndD
MFSSISLCNFKQYKGEHEIQLDSKEKENIILFYGPNGSGKTTLLEAIRFAILGRRLLELNGNQDGSYEEYLHSVVNQDINKENTPIWVKINLILEHGHSISIQRSVISNNGSYSDNLQISNGTTPIGLIPTDYWEDFLYSLVPTEVSEFFFLDGEGIKQLITGNRAEELIKSSAKDLMGLSLITVLEEDLSRLSTKLGKKKNRNKKTLTEIQTKREHIEKINSNIESFEREVTTLKKEISKLARESHKLEKEARLKIGYGTKDHKTSQTFLFDFLGDQKTLNEELNDLCEILLPVALAGSDAQKLNRKVKEIQNSGEIILNSQDSVHLKKALISSLKKSKDISNELTKSQIGLIIKEIGQSFNMIFKAEHDYQILQGLNNAQLKEVQNWLDLATKDNVLESIKYIIGSKEELVKKKANMLKMRGQIGQSIEEFISRSGELREERLQKEAKRIDLLKKIEDLNILKNQERETLNSLETAAFESMRDDEKLRVCLDAKKVAIEYSKILISKKSKDLSKEISNMHKLIAQKKDQINAIEILPDSFKVVLKDALGRKISPSRLSTGESEIYSLSVLWGLERISQRTLPIIIDAPFEKLDKKHVSNLVTKLLPIISNQVLLFAHDRELDSNTIKEIKPKITKLFSITRPSSKEGSQIEEKSISSWGST